LWYWFVDFAEEEEMAIRTFPQKRLPEQDDPLTRRIIACAIEVFE
jgi:hypothetical protein